MESVPPPPSLRRPPVQRRSAERLARILDACADLLDLTGYDELTTRDVAARAGVPIGSVYRFFADKRAMAKALAHRNLDRYAARVAARLAAEPGLDGHATVDLVLDEYLAMKRTVPGFALVDFGVPGPSVPPGEDPNGRVADLIAPLLAGRADPDEVLCRKVRAGVEAADALLRLAFRADPAGDPELIAETREMLHAYLAPVLR
ncbi:TetR/AcrR family transcriptional regulator [Streptomyces thermolilacinus]|uniref:TetR family transcriptional regulator n=1 Tax=Streptomyces thermolilacinus SPC6 TaxID=1306406 RepID=A0A1D3DX50_9ACTN|nr:TetR/AcrR family transcriptional regulator [Streptomyces thermolilacinus]OEJ96894.1 TetR family transcriptional regulator [Streptomyces thermolilacinus SPC6]